MTRQEYEDLKQQSRPDLFKPTPEYTEEDLRSMWEDFQEDWQRRGYSSAQAQRAAESFIRGMTGRTTYHLIPKDQRLLKHDLSLYPGLI